MKNRVSNIVFMVVFISVGIMFPCSSVFFKNVYAGQTQAASIDDAVLNSIYTVYDYILQGDFDKAIEYGNKAFTQIGNDINGSTLIVYLGVATAYQLKKDYKGAVSAYEKLRNKLNNPQIGDIESRAVMNQLENTILPFLYVAVGEKDKVVQKEIRDADIEVIHDKISQMSEIALKNLKEAQLKTNEAYAKANLRSLAIAAETFSAVNSGVYPTQVTSPGLVDYIASAPSYCINANGTTTAVKGYNYGCTLTASGYIFVATPVTVGTTGTTTYTATTGGVLTPQ